MKKQKIRLLFRSFDHQQLDKAVRDVLRIVAKAGSVVKGPIPMPNRTQYFTVLRSPNNDKKARDQFGLINHKRIMDIEMAMQAPKVVEDTMNSLMRLEVSAAVDIEIKTGVE
jgi:small subunit ribosomal protein S10